MTAEELTSVTTFRAEFNLITHNSSLMDICLDVRCECVFVFPLYTVYLWKNTHTLHTSIYFPINGLSEKVVCVQRQAR